MCVVLFKDMCVFWFCSAECRWFWFPVWRSRNQTGFLGFHTKLSFLCFSNFLSDLKRFNSVSAAVGQRKVFTAAQQVRPVCVCVCVCACAYVCVFGSVITADQDKGLKQKTDELKQQTEQTVWLTAHRQIDSQADRQTGFISCLTFFIHSVISAVRRGRKCSDEPADKTTAERRDDLQVTRSTPDDGSGLKVLRLRHTSLNNTSASLLVAPNRRHHGHMTETSPPLRVLLHNYYPGFL